VRARSSSEASPIRRVVVVSSSYAPHTGGVEEVVRQLASMQRQAGIETSVITMRWPKSLSQIERIDGTLVERFTFRSPEGSLRRVTAAAATNPLTLLRFIRSVRRARPDVLHVHCVSSSAWFALQAPVRCDCPWSSASMVS
jgi:hypothetical protein